ncbi:MAG: hypothetical protein FJZ43_04400 [Candidatus Staskawiczbacteria bacterium]|nr:hypothetical protein [Candidatus Staskawiczbacteria bacterium]
MKIKTKNLKEFMEYIEDENPEELDIVTIENGFAVSFAFFDKENRECKVVIYESSISDSQPVELIKKMKLRTRLPKEQDGDK